MTEAIQGILAEARKNRFCTINPSLSDDDVASVWDNVSAFIEKQMSNQKGVTINGLGTFTFVQKKLDVGNNKYIQIQRPVFQISEKFAQSQALQCSKYHIPGQIPVVPLNFAALAFESPFDRDTVESCVKEVLGAITRAVGNKRNVELTFSGIGRLSIRESKVKMRFYKEFITQMDGTGKLISSMQNRPGTMDSVMSDRSTARPSSNNTILLPRLNPIGVGQNLTPLPEMVEEPVEGEVIQPGAMVEGEAQGCPIDHVPLPEDYQLDTSSESPQRLAEQAGIDGQMVILDTCDAATANAITNIMKVVTPDQHYELYKPTDDEPVSGVTQPQDTGVNVEASPVLSPDFGTTEEMHRPSPPSRSGSRTTIPLAQATGVSLTDDLFQLQKPKPPSRGAQVMRSSPDALQTQCDELNKPHTPPRLEPLERSRTEPFISDNSDRQVLFNVPSTACGHPNAGQELCYLCHQRARRNIPVSFTEEIKRREEEDDRLLRQYQAMKDAEEALKEQDKMLTRRQDLQKIAAFNLGVSDAIKDKKYTRDTEFHKSYIFQKRPLTPPKFFKQEEYCKDLSKQVDSKEQTKKKRKNDQEFLERLEQVQLAEDLAAQREKYLVDKFGNQEKYRKALDTQAKICDVHILFCTLHILHTSQSLECGYPGGLDILTQRSSSQLIPTTCNLQPFSNTYMARVTEKLTPTIFTVKKLRYKPLPIPAKESDFEIFGKHDMNNEKMAERRQRAYELFREQQDLVAQRKREAILKRLAEQREEEAVLDRTKRELLEDRASRFTRRFETRKSLENDWCQAAECKRARDLEERLRGLTPGLLLHETVDKHRRCRQCQRKLPNCGESNIWRESRYIPGSRLMV